MNSNNIYLRLHNKDFDLLRIWRLDEDKIIIVKDFNSIRNSYMKWEDFMLWANHGFNFFKTYNINTSYDILTEQEVFMELL